MTIAALEARRRTVEHLPRAHQLHRHGGGAGRPIRPRPWDQRPAVAPGVRRSGRATSPDRPRPAPSRSVPGAADQAFGLGALADVLEAFCAAADLDDLDLVANDTGGGIAQIFAAAHPERIRSLCLTNCETHDNVPPPAFKPTVDLAATGALAAGAPRLLADLGVARALVFGSGYEDTEHLGLDVVRSFLEPVLGTPERAHEFERFIVSLRADDLLAAEADLGELRTPTLIVWGTADVFFELSWAYWLRDLIPGARDVVEVEGGRLFFPDERPEELVDPLRAFWWDCR